MLEELLEVDNLVEEAAEEDCDALLLADVDCVGFAEPPEDEEFIVRDGLAEIILDRILDKYALPLRESESDDEELWGGWAWELDDV